MTSYQTYTNIEFYYSYSTKCVFYHWYKDLYWEIFGGCYTNLTFYSTLLERQDNKRDIIIKHRNAELDAKKANAGIFYCTLSYVIGSQISFYEDFGITVRAYVFLNPVHNTDL